MSTNNKALVLLLGAALLALAVVFIASSRSSQTTGSVQGAVPHAAAPVQNVLPATKVPHGREQQPSAAAQSARPDVASAVQRRGCDMGDSPRICQRRQRFWARFDAFVRQHDITPAQAGQLEAVLADAQAELDVLVEAYNLTAQDEEVPEHDAYDVPVQQAQQRVQAVLSPAQYAHWWRAFDSTYLLTQLGHYRPFMVPAVEDVRSQYNQLRYNKPIERREPRRP